MPSSNVRDGLPTYYGRTQRLREIAAAVIRSLPRSRHQLEDTENSARRLREQLRQDRHLQR